MTKENNEPIIVKRDNMIADSSYVNWLKDLKKRYRSSQTKAAVAVNAEMLKFYWSLGRDINFLKVEVKWGDGLLSQLSLDLKNIFPQETGFSVTNLKYMKRWYHFYYDAVVIRRQAADESGDETLFPIRQQAADELEMPEIFALVPWMHHVRIFSKCQDLKEAIFYIRKTIDGNWSRTVLDDNLKYDLFNKQGKALTNFSTQTELPQGVLAQEILKDPYNFNFLAMRQGYNERDFEDALVGNITRFLLELGQGFAFVGRQMELQMPNGKAYFPDLVFYHTKLKCYIVVELKVVDFIPEFVGKLNFYVSAADELLKQDDDNPSIGLLVCKSHDKTTVEWSFRGINRPIGVASYQLEEVVDRTIAEINQNITDEEGGDQ
jgi:predicted nuclease of restriction endonuclease-like (RecB) superfamily